MCFHKISITIVFFQFFPCIYIVFSHKLYINHVPSFLNFRPPSNQIWNSFLKRKKNTNCKTISINKEAITMNSIILQSNSLSLVAVAKTQDLRALCPAESF